MAFQLKLSNLRFPRYDRVRWSRLLVAVGPLHLLKVTVEPKNHRTTEGNDEAPKGEMKRPSPLPPFDRVVPTPPRARRIELPPQSETVRAGEPRLPSGIRTSTSDGTYHGRPHDLTGATALSGPPARGVMGAPPTASSGNNEGVAPAVPTHSFHLDEAELDLLANLLCESGLGSSPSQRKPCWNVPRSPNGSSIP